LTRTTDPLRRRLDRATLTAFGGWTILSLLLVLGTFTSLEQAESTERNAVQDRAEAGATVVEQTMLREFEAVNRLLDLAQVRLTLAQNVTAKHDDDKGFQDVDAEQSMLQQQMQGIKGLLKITIVHISDGTLDLALHTDDGANVARSEVLVDERAKLARSGMVISAPAMVAITDENGRFVADAKGNPKRRWVVNASRALTDKAGVVREVAVVSLDPVGLSEMIGLPIPPLTAPRNDLKEASVVQLADTGQIIARSTNLELGLRLAVSPNDPVLQQARGLPDCLAKLDTVPNAYQEVERHKCHKFRDRLNGVDRLVGFAAPEFPAGSADAPPNAPLVVSRSLDTDGALTDFYALRSIILSVVLALVVGALVATRLFLANFLLRQRLGDEALRDPLTGLRNRRYFTDEMSRKMANATRQGETAAVLLIDLDGFKQVNDTRGHPVGDALLRDVADRLRHCVASNDTVIRLGGDEFAVVRLGRPQRRDVTALARYIVNELSETYEVEKFHVRISASVGVAMPPDGGEDLNDLLRSADIALYFVKSEGGSAYQLFDPAMENSVRTRRALEIDLREALGRGELEVYYQPLVQIDPHRVSGFEALLRWHHPTLGMVMPSRFIPVAEETGLIAPIGEWVLHQACLEASHWPERTRIAVNLSPIQFERSDIVDIVAAALRESRLEPDRLELEITEGVVMRDSGDVLATMRRLRNLGVRLALDDFGTGYSSLSYLRSFPFDKVKIDGSFLADLAGDGGTIIRAVLGLCRHLDLDMLVEGVETEEQLDWLRREGCAEVQGHLFSPPRPVTGVMEIIVEVAGRTVRRVPAEVKV
jgi:diguanylate cyclase (GGDEF)-like protein